MRRLLVPLDGSERGDQVLTFLDRMLPELRACELLLARVIGPGEAMDAACERLEGTARRLRSAGMPTVTLTVVGDPAEEILKLAELTQPTLVALSTHGAGASRQKHGSLAARVIEGCSAPVLIVGRQALPMDPGPGLARVVVALDGSQGADVVLPVVGEMARPSDAEVVLLTVDGPGAPVDLDLARNRLLRHGIDRVRVLRTKGPVAEALLDVARRESADLLAMGARGRTAGTGLGSVARDVAQQCELPLLLVR